jgi:hypothetical protein
MKPGAATRRIVRRPALSRLILTLIASTLSSSCSSKPSAPVQGSNPQPAVHSAGSVANGATVLPHDCPPFISFPEAAAVNGKGDHRVILSWNASAAADADHADAIGYCIYRGTKSGDRSMVRVNHKPFRGTTCTDNMVRNGETYYYKVRAISAQGYASKASNLALAHIPNRKPAVTTMAPPPSCQVADATQ